MKLLSEVEGIKFLIHLDNHVLNTFLEIRKGQIIIAVRRPPKFDSHVFDRIFLKMKSVVKCSVVDMKNDRAGFIKRKDH